MSKPGPGSNFSFPSPFQISIVLPTIILVAYLTSVVLRTSGSGNVAVVTRVMTKILGLSVVIVFDAKVGFNPNNLSGYPRAKIFFF